MDKFTLPKSINYLLFFILLTVILYYSREFLIPIAFGSLLAMLFLPLSNRFERLGANRGVATVLCIIIFLLVIAGLIMLLSWQLSDIAQDITQMQQRASSFIEQARKYISETFQIAPEKQKALIQKQQSSGDAGKLAGSILTGALSMLVNFILVLVYVFLFMYFRRHLKNSLLKMVPDGERKNTEVIVHDASKVAQKYLSGLATMIVILWIMYGIGFTLIGVKSAIFFAILCGLLEIIPFVGNITGTALTMLMVLSQGGNTQMILGVFIIYFIIQFIQSYILEPLVVGAEVNINPIFTILVLVGGELIWGIPGLILAIPILGIVKIICDPIEPLKPYGFLMGQEKKKKDDSPWVKKLKKVFT
ncbi:MAG TPA: AI-2E family transporter [Sphingobacteriaceae bacterium]|nr:AI-2E family transporter [Sphingobacteriaceae bacterium]